MNDQSHPSPGWYDNPEGEGQRFWDGIQWTEKYRPAPPTGEPSEDTSSKVDSSTKQGCLGLVIIAVLLTVAFAVCSGGEGDSGASDTAAYVMCQQFVKDRLKSPATAGFPLSSDAQITSTGDDQWRVVSHVDSENSFGANVRARFSCEVRYVGDDNWRLVNINIQE